MTLSASETSPFLVDKPAPGVTHSTQNGVGRTERVTEVDGDVEVRYVELRSPPPSDFPKYPAECDTLGYLRYRLMAGPERAENADAICVMMPGSWGGAYSLDCVARNTLRAAAARGATIEWWSLGRRASLAWDRTGIDAAIEAGDPDLAFEYYYGGLAIDGRRFAGFTPDRELRWLGELGLAQTVRDQHEVLTREIADPSVRRSKVFVGGHSLGGIISGFLGAWDFGGEPGHDLYAGLVCIDTLAEADPFRLQESTVARLATKVGIGHLHHRVVQGVRHGLFPRTFAATQITAPETLNLLALAALDAVYSGDEESTLHQRVPTTGSLGVAERFYFARTWRQFITGRPGIRDFRVTGEGALVALMSDRHNPIDPLSSSIGRLDGPLAPKSFPLPPWFRRVPGLGPLASGLVDMGTHSAPSDPDHLYRWRKPDEYEGDDVVDLHDFARVLLGGPLGFLEGWFPMRLTYDTGFALLGARDGDLDAIRHQDEARRKPRVHVLGDAGSFVPVLMRALRLLPADATTTPGYRHIDMVTGAAERPGRPCEPVAAAISDFIVQQVHP